MWFDTRHPALTGFPMAEEFDWRWADLIRGAQGVNLDRLPRELQPIIQGIDDWNRNYKLGVVFECRVGSGRLMVSAVDLNSTQKLNSTARLLRRSLLEYMAGSQFQPRITVSVDDLRGLLFDTQIMRRLGAVATAPLPDKTRPTATGPEKAIDGDPNTYWLTGDSRSRHPHTLTVAFPAPVAMAGLVLLPRQDHYEHVGDIRDYGIEVSDDGREWREVKVGKLISSFVPQEINFDSVITARSIRLTAASGFGEDGAAALAELAVIYAGPKLTDSIAGIYPPPTGAVVVTNDEERRELLRKGPLGPAARFDFGGLGPVVPGYQQVLPASIYGQGRGYGFEPGTQVVAISRDESDPVRGDFITSDRPFSFSVALPEGNYNVTVTLGDAEGETSTTVRAELQRLMLDQIRTAPGQYTTRTFTVNVRRPQISTGRVVRLKDRGRSTEHLTWDERLTLEFSGARPAVCAVEIVPSRAPMIFLLGDSTVADRPRDSYSSWGQMLPRFFQPGVAVANHAEAGESVRSFYEEMRVSKVLSSIRQGDYLLIEFGHDDQLRSGINSTSESHNGLYELLQEAKDRGAIPVLVTPSHRRTFDERGRLFNSLGDYPAMVIRLARSTRTPLIDLHAMSKDLYESLGPDRSGPLFVSGDNTHHSSEGAYRLAQLVVDGIKRNQLDLAKYLVE
jgi:lysophospholipase L1-like esterase